jgi:HPr kinase/phosphorylase
MSSGTPAFTHANALLLGETGVLLRGATGAGKSTLSYELIARARLQGQFAALIGDDRLTLANCNGRLIARPHPAIEGAIELRGLGIAAVPFEPAGVIRCVVDLKAPGGLERYPSPEAAATQLCGLWLPRCFVELRDVAAVAKIFFFVQKLSAK